MKTVNKLISEAVEEDISGNLSKAYKLYCEGLQYYIPIISNEKDNNRKNHFRELANEYMRRAEEIKIALKPCSTIPDTSSDKADTDSEISNFSNKNNFSTNIEPSSIYNKLCMICLLSMEKNDVTN